MNNLMKAVATCLTACAASTLISHAALASQNLSSVQQENTYSVSINNTCSRDIRVAVHYQHPQRGWITRGWWEVEARSELQTDIVSNHNQFYMHGEASARRQWPPVRSRKQYNRYEVLENEDFILEANQNVSPDQGVPFSLKEISPTSQGLKARFDC